MKYLSILDPNAERSLFNTKSIEASLPSASKCWANFPPTSKYEILVPEILSVAHEPAGEPFIVFSILFIKYVSF